MEAYTLQDANGKELINMEVSTLRLDFQYNPHTHNKLEISLVKSGHGTYNIGERCYDIQSSDVFLISNTEMHNIVINDNSVLVNLVLHFESEFLWDLLGHDPDDRLLKVFFSRNENFQHRLNRKNPATLRSAKILLEIEREMMDKPLYYDLQVRLLMKSLLLLILREYEYFELDDPQTAITQREAYMAKETLRYIEQNISNNLSLAEIANVACLSPTYFSSLFKRYNGITISAYIARKRVEQAVHLIRSTNLNLTEVAVRCGFNNSTSFNKTFKRLTGEVPSFFRKSPGAQIE